MPTIKTMEERRRERQVRLEEWRKRVKKLASAIDIYLSEHDIEYIVREFEIVYCDGKIDGLDFAEKIWSPKKA
jgi:hypothetical protein